MPGEAVELLTDISQSHHDMAMDDSDISKLAYAMRRVDLDNNNMSTDVTRMVT